MTEKTPTNDFKPNYVSETYGRADVLARIKLLIDQRENFYLFGEQFSGLSHMTRTIVDILYEKKLPYESFARMPTAKDLDRLYQSIIRDNKDIKYSHNIIKDDGKSVGKLANLIKDIYIDGKGFPKFYFVIDNFELNENSIKILDILSQYVILIFTCKESVPEGLITQFTCLRNLKVINLPKLSLDDQHKIMNYWIENYNLNILRTAEFYREMSFWLRRNDCMPGDIWNAVVTKIFPEVVNSPRGTFNLKKLRGILNASSSIKKRDGEWIIHLAACIVIILAYAHISQFRGNNLGIIMAMYAIFLFTKGKKIFGQGTNVIWKRRYK